MQRFLASVKMVVELVLCCILLENSLNPLPDLDNVLSIP